MVRMDRHIPYEKRMARVEEVIQEVSLKDQAVTSALNCSVIINVCSRLFY